MKNKEQWANEVLQSLEGIQRAEPRAELFAKISQKLPKERPVKMIHLKQLPWVAAAACILIVVNIFFFKSSIHIKNPTTNNYNSEYSFLTNYNIYD